ncbi:MAG: S8 family serine peptidase, partial [Blastocatellia bacterium]|nr:S8 family serine peptidase [Blastocatellia bacterium]
MSTPIRALENAVRKTKSSGQEKPEFDEKAQNTTKLLLQLEDKPEVEKDIYELIHELAVIAKKHNWQEVERHWHNLLAIVQRVSRRGELKKPSSEEEFKKNLWWMSERGTKEDLPLLQKLKQSPPYPKSEVSDLIETVIGTIKKKVERSNAMNLDPRLQKLIFDVKRGTTKLPTSSTDTNEVAVIAKVSDLAAWENLSEVRPGAKIEADDGDYLVSGRIPILRIENVRSQPFVKSLKAAQKLSPTLHKTTEETMSRADLLPEGNLANGGKGVVVGIIDFGCDFVHKNFRNADGTTRLLALWDQSSSAQHNSPFGYGRVYTQEKINEALKNSDPYTHLGYQPPHDTILEAAGSHGTHVTDIAAGNGLGSSVPGVAPDADIIFVELTNTLPDDEEKRAEKLTETSFGDTVQLFEAVQFIFEQAGDRPCVVNISLGTHGGPHDGTTLVEQILDGSVKELPNRAIVIAAGNLSDDEVHTSGVVPEGGSADLEWHIPESNADENELELWYSGEDRFSLDLI